MRISDWSSDVCSSDLLSVTWWQNKSDTVAGQGIGFTPATNPVTGTSNSRFFNAPGLADHLAANFPTRASQADWAPEAGRSDDVGRGAGLPGKSEEHTSALQSLMRISYAVFRLKKKKYK